MLSRTMKTLFALSLLSLVGLNCSGDKKLPEGIPSRYEYRYSGPVMYPMDWYLVEAGEDGTVRILSSHDGPEILVVRAPEDIFEQIDALVRKYKLQTLKRDYEPSFQVMDGFQWSLSIRYPEYKGVYSSGYHAWPKASLREGIDAINALLKGISEAAQDEDILGHESHDTRR